MKIVSMGLKGTVSTLPDKGGRLLLGEAMMPGVIRMGRCLGSWRSRKKFLYALYEMKRQETAIKCM